MASWFYLTLWHGTPPEFTSEAEIEIGVTSNAPARICTSDNTYMGIVTDNDALASIRGETSADTDVITTSEVIWYVGRTGN